MKKKILYLLTCVGLCWSSCTNEVDEFIGNVEPSTRSVSTALNANLASLFTGGAPTLTSAEIKEVNDAYAKMTSINCYRNIDEAVRNKTSYAGTIFLDDTYVSIRPTTGIKPLYTTIATVTMNLIVSAAIVLLNPYVTVYISYKIPPFALSVHIPDVSTSIYVEVDSKVLLGLPSCDKAFVR